MKLLKSSHRFKQGWQRIQQTTKQATGQTKALSATERTTTEDSGKGRKRKTPRKGLVERLLEPRKDWTPQARVPSARSWRRQLWLLHLRGRGRGGQEAQRVTATVASSRAWKHRTRNCEDHKDRGAEKISLYRKNRTVPAFPGQEPYLATNATGNGKTGNGTTGNGPGTASAAAAGNMIQVYGMLGQQSEEITRKEDDVISNNGGL